MVEVTSTKNIKKSGHQLHLGDLLRIIHHKGETKSQSPQPMTRKEQSTLSQHASKILGQTNCGRKHEWT